MQDSNYTSAPLLNVQCDVMCSNRAYALKIMNCYSYCKCRVWNYETSKVWDYGHWRLWVPIKASCRPAKLLNLVIAKPLPSLSSQLHRWSQVCILKQGKQFVYVQVCRLVCGVLSHLNDYGLGNCEAGQVIKNNHWLGPTELWAVRLVLTGNYFW